MELKNYPKEFVERTSIMLEKLEPSAKENGLEVTFFLNCLLGMVVSTLENIDNCDKKLFNQKLNDENIRELIPNKIKAIRDSELTEVYKKKINQFGFLKNMNESEIEIKNLSIKFINKEELMNHNLEWLLRKIRNGIAHQNIMPINDSKKWKGIRIWNYNNKGVQNFAIEFRINELKLFSKFIVQLYLKSLQV